MNSTRPSPIIIIGMHRSGTTMITGILENLGLFMGARQNVMQEASFFLHINRWILHHTGGSWIQPETIDSLLANAQANQLVTDYIAFLLGTPRIINYMGVRSYLRYRHPARLPLVWGWKDPCTTFTLPLWLRLFPDARVIHIYRNGIDVANSLYVRSQKNVAKLTDWQAFKRRWRYALHPSKHPKSDSHYLSLSEGHRLWEGYTRRADEHIASLPPQQARVIGYEAFLSDPLPILRDLCEFTGVHYTPDQLIDAVRPVDPSRAYAFKGDPTLRDFYEEVKHTPQMVKYGYDRLFP